MHKIDCERYESKKAEKLNRFEFPRKVDVEVVGMEKVMKFKPHEIRLALIT